MRWESDLYLHTNETERFVVIEEELTVYIDDIIRLYLVSNLIINGQYLLLQ